MAELYVVTDESGRQEHEHEPVTWPLPPAGDRDGEAAGGPADAVEGELELYEARALLGRLGACIWRGETLAPSAADGVVRASRARIVSGTAWSGVVAAGFALDCAEHVAEEAAHIELVGGTTVAQALVQAREWLAAADPEPGVVGKVRDLALAWRLRREGKAIGDAALAAFVSDNAAAVEAMDDPVWTAVAAARDAVLAAVEAVQHAVFPRLTRAEAETYEGAEATVSGGPAIHRHAPTAWVPYWTAADDAAERARQAAAAGDPGAASAPGDDQDELAWQADRLVALLGEADLPA